MVLTVYRLTVVRIWYRAPVADRLVRFYRLSSAPHANSVARHRVPPHIMLLARGSPHRAAAALYQLKAARTLLPRAYRHCLVINVVELRRSSGR